MIKKKLKFKTYKKFEENLNDNSKFTFTVYNSSKFQKKRWSSILKTSYSNASRNSLKVSSFYSKDLYSEQKQTLINFSKKNILSLVKALVETKFARSPKEAFFLIKMGFIYINGRPVYSSAFVLKAGDVVNIKKASVQQDWVSRFFFTKYKSITTVFKIPVRYEISFSGSFFVVCFL